jgi:hypothetical protein
MSGSRIELSVALVHLACLLSMEETRAQPVRADTIPFTLTAFNNVIVPVVFNEVDTLQLMFHSSFTGVSVTQEGLKRCTTMRTDGEGTAQSWGGSGNSPVSLNNKLRIGKGVWDSLTVTIDEQSGQGSDGKFGYDLFADGILEINYDRNELVVHGSLPERRDGYSPFLLRMGDGSLYVQADVTLMDSAYTDWFMFHTGYGGSCILGTGFMSGINGPVKLDTLGVKELSDALGNTLKNVSTRIRSISLGGGTFRDLRIQVMDPRSNFEASVLGNDLLRRFNALFDFPKRLVYLKPSGLFEAPISDRF